MMTTKKVTTETTTNFVDGKLPILVSARVRLDSEQRQALKDAYYAMQRAEPRVTTDATTTLSVVTSMASDLERQLGMSRLVVMDLLNSRDTININLILKLQEVLDTEVITKDDLAKACESYTDYIFN